MVKDGMMERFGIQEVYGMHNMPGLPRRRIRDSGPGPLLAAADRIIIEIEGLGSHAAAPASGASTGGGRRADRQQAQTIVSRSVDPIKSGLISICQFPCRLGRQTSSRRPRPARARRAACCPEVRDTLRTALREIVENTEGATAHGDASPYNRHYPVTSNTRSDRALRPRLARRRRRHRARRYQHAAADGRRGFLLHAGSAPGAFIFIGNGDSAGLHHPAYDFNDDVIPVGASFWARLVETAMPA
jgi:hippurate hydrolase